MSTLAIRDLHVQVESDAGPREILRGVDLTIESALWLSVRVILKCQILEGKGGRMATGSVVVEEDAAFQVARAAVADW